MPKEYKLSEIQKVALRAYSDGDFSWFADQGAITDEALRDAGDTLLRFVVVELAESEDCSGPDVAVSRMRRAIDDLEAVLAALEEFSATRSV